MEFVGNYDIIKYVKENSLTILDKFEYRYNET